MLKAAEQALRHLRRPEDVAKARGKAVRDVLPPRAAADPATGSSAPAAPTPPAAPASSGEGADEAAEGTSSGED
jgi:hypothetical protein